MLEKSQKMEQYFKSVQKEVEKAYKISNEARKKGYDPEERVDATLAKNMAERVFGLISSVAPQINEKALVKRINELEKKYGKLAWQIALIIAKEVAQEKFCKFKDKKEAMEIGIRTGFAYHTNGIVAAPLEGFTELVIKKRKDGKEYVAMKFSGPVRGAGGTAASVSVIIGDYVRKEMGYSPYDPTEKEINRYVTEINDYHERVTNLQYFPSEEEIRFLTKHLPIEVDGDPTEKIEVSNYKDLERVETNSIRGGVCLVLAEGISQKAKKLWKRLEVWGKDFGLEWGFLKEFLELQKRIRAHKEKAKEPNKIEPNYTFIMDLVAGRPVLTHPMAPGGFRLRYGRTRTSGYSSAAIHPFTQFLLNKYIATGTQLKVERPGKATAVTICENIEPPIVKLNDGSVIRLDTKDKLKEHLGEVSEILFLGDILFNYGDFSENGHVLVPPGYCEEWWTLELEKAIVDTFGSFDLEKLSEFVNISPEGLSLLIQKPQSTKISLEAAFSISKKLSIPLHPKFTFYWSLLTKDELLGFLNVLNRMRIEKEGDSFKIIIPFDERPKKVLEKIGAPHLVVNKEFLVLDKTNSAALLKTLSIEKLEDVDECIIKAEESPSENVLELINLLSPVPIRDKAGTFIGARMGRPEKAKMRKLTGSPQVLFPVGKEGGRLRCFQSAMEKGKIKADFPVYKCNKCNKTTIYRVCEVCEKKAVRLYNCRVCGLIEKEHCPKHPEMTLPYKTQEIDINHYFSKSLEKLKEKTYPDLIKGVRGTSNKDHTPENLLKGILRAKHDIAVNKDGTTRYDMTELPITAFKPKEIGVDMVKLKELGYEKDIHGNEIISDDQIIELFPQDIILPATMNAMEESAKDVLFRTTKFVDELLVKLYGLKPYYSLKEPNDLIGHYVVGLAPHISAGMIGRIIGFSQTQGCFAHPLWHAALRRDCDGDECSVSMLLDVLLNFSRQYLPDKRGSRTMDAPLVLTSELIPSEVDDMVHGIDKVWKYPLEFYEAALAQKYPWDVKIEQLADNIGTEKQYEQFGFTHEVSSINAGVLCSAYKTLPSMEDKLKGQMEIAQKIRAVDESDVARLVIEKHFLKDIKGNLRKFSTQQYRCVDCNEKFRRPPLSGKCP
ncbi:DNA polymerase II large subunit [Candidatus Woesearchaeota archaeon]|nr:MAG: DNA polymerase II large subunit [Candidatus Woesearchaeota archaeon]